MFVFWQRIIGFLFELKLTLCLQVRIRENCNILVLLPEGCYKSEGARGGVLGGSSTKSKINYDYGMVGWVEQFIWIYSFFFL